LNAAVVNEAVWLCCQLSSGDFNANQLPAVKARINTNPRQVFQ
jgi:hypothetical protein